MQRGAADNVAEASPSLAEPWQSCTIRAAASLLLDAAIDSRSAPAYVELAYICGLFLPGTGLRTRLRARFRFDRTTLTAAGSRSSVSEPMSEIVVTAGAGGCIRACTLVTAAALFLNQLAKVTCQHVAKTRQLDVLGGEAGRVVRCPPDEDGVVYLHVRARGLWLAGCHQQSAYMLVEV
jgi:hypothetical protein